MKHYYCDGCISKAVADFRVQPLLRHFPPNKVLFKKGVKCSACGRQGDKHEGFWKHPEMDKIYEPKNLAPAIDHEKLNNSIILKEIIYGAIDYFFDRMIKFEKEGEDK